MSQGKFISRFSPNRTNPEHLEKIHVQRHELLQQAVELLRESALTENKHHLLFIGPRGCGKTHLLALIFHRLQQQTNLAGRLRIAWLNEDETSTSFLDLLVRIYQALANSYPEEFPAAELDSVYGRPPDEAREILGQMLIRRIGKHAVLVMMENLDVLFDQLDDPEQRTWRAFIQNHPVFATAATAQRLFAGVSNREQPFFGFFDTRHLHCLTVDEAGELLQRIARLNEDTDLIEYLGTARGRARVHAIHHLAGGNHRLYIVLSDFITRQSLDELVRPFEEMVDEQLTPYYQERLRWLSPQQRKIIEFLCLQVHPVPVKEIAERLFATHSTITSQLKQLREMGYVESKPRGRESLYELAEPLMRLSMQVKKTPQREPLGLMVDFLRVWYERDELEARLDKFDANAPEREYFAAAIARYQPGEPNLRHQILRHTLEGFDVTHCDADQLAALKTLAEETREFPDLMNYATACFFTEDYASAIEVFSKVIKLPGAPVESVVWALIARGIAFGRTDRIGEEIADYTKVIELPGAPVEQVAMALLNRGFTFGQTGRTEEEITDYTRVIELPGAPVEQVEWVLYNRGVTFGQTGRTEEAIADYTRVIELPGASVEQVAMALVNRGIVFGQTGRTEKAIIDYNRVIELPGAPVEQVARAIISRGNAFGRTGRTDKAIADCTRVIELPGAPVEGVARALVNRGITFGQTGRTEEAIVDFTRVIELPEAPVEQVINARVFLAELLFDLDRWSDALEQVAPALDGREASPSSIAGATDSAMAAILRHIGARDVWRKRAGELIALYAARDSLAILGNALVRHLAQLGESLLSGKGLDEWLAGWEAAGAEHPDLRLPLRLVRVGIAYLKATPRDEGVLLDLPSEERRLARQALGLQLEGE